jgi:hypothetical protein
VGRSAKIASGTAMDQLRTMRLQKKEQSKLLKK